MIHTPWGQADSVRPILNGVVSVSTPSHGGLRVTRKAFNDLAMDKQYLGKVAIKTREHYWFEEDCAAALFMFDAPSVIKPWVKAHFRLDDGPSLDEKAETIFQSCKRITESYYKEYFTSEG